MKNKIINIFLSIVFGSILIANSIETYIDFSSGKPLIGTVDVFVGIAFLILMVLEISALFYKKR